VITSLLAVTWWWPGRASTRTAACRHLCPDAEYDGQFLNAAFQVNQFTDNNQRNPAIAALTNGNFVIAWVSGKPDRVGRGSFAGRQSGGYLCPDF